MHAIQVHIDETLDASALREVADSLRAIPHVEQVACDSHAPHELLVEYDEHHVQPMDIVSTLQQRGLHPDVISG